MKKSNQQQQDQQESLFIAYRGEIRQLGIKVRLWANGKAAYPGEAITAYLTQYGGTNLIMRTILAKAIIIDCIQLVERFRLKKSTKNCSNKPAKHPHNDTIKTLKNSDFNRQNIS